MSFISRGAKKPAKGGRAQAAADLPNTPPIAVNKSVTLFAELFGDPQVHAARWFVVSVLLMLVVIAQASVIVGMMPLKQIRPYVVEATDTGVVARAIEASAYRPTNAMVRAELSRWSEQLMTLDPHQTREMLKRSTALLRGKAVSEHGEFLKQTRPFERLLENPTLVRTVQPLSVDTSKDGLAFIWFQTTERVNAQAKTTRWRMTVHYTISTPATEQELLANPAGLAITHFEMVQEG